MNVSLEYLERCSAQTDYLVPPLEKVVRLGEMAGDVARHPRSSVADLHSEATQGSRHRTHRGGATCPDAGCDRTAQGR